MRIAETSLPLSCAAICCAADSLISTMSSSLYAVIHYPLHRMHGGRGTNVYHFLRPSAILCCSFFTTKRTKKSARRTRRKEEHIRIPKSAIRNPTPCPLYFIASVNVVTPELMASVISLSQVWMKEKCFCKCCMASPRVRNFVPILW